MKNSNNNINNINNLNNINNINIHHYNISSPLSYEKIKIQEKLEKYRKMLNKKMKDKNLFIKFLCFLYNLFINICKYEFNI